MTFLQFLLKPNGAKEIGILILCPWAYGLYKASQWEGDKKEPIALLRYQPVPAELQLPQIDYRSIIEQAEIPGHVKRRLLEMGPKLSHVITAERMLMEELAKSHVGKQMVEEIEHEPGQIASQLVAVAHGNQARETRLRQAIERVAARGGLQ